MRAGGSSRILIVRCVGEGNIVRGAESATKRQPALLPREFVKHGNQSAMNVTPRDIDALHLVRDIRFLTIDQAMLCVYRNRNVAQRRLSAMEELDYLKSFGMPALEKGRPTKVYYLSGRKRRELETLLNPWWGGAPFPKPPPDNLTLARHALELNDVLCTMIAGSELLGLSCRVIPEHINISTGKRMQRVLDDEVSDPANTVRTIRYRRDAVCMIGSSKGKALLEIEYDCGSEVVESRGWRKVTLEKKVAVFMQTLKERRFERYSSPDFFDAPFNTSRLLLITTSAKRLQNIARVCNRVGTHGMVYLATVETIRPDSIFGPAWIVPENGIVTRKSLVGSHE
jgi:hypothetical protein